MDLWPRADRKLRRRLLAEARRRQISEEACGLSPTERLHKAETLRQLAHSLAPPCRTQSPSDEPPELWLNLLARWRCLDQEQQPDGNPAGGA